jgi:hypothetical protein
MTSGNSERSQSRKSRVTQTKDSNCFASERKSVDRKVRSRTCYISHTSNCASKQCRIQTASARRQNLLLKPNKRKARSIPLSTGRRGAYRACESRLKTLHRAEQGSHELAPRRGERHRWNAIGRPGCNVGVRDTGRVRVFARIPKAWGCGARAALGRGWNTTVNSVGARNDFGDRSTQPHASH